jgi:NitT/TauT family transport system permease protein
VSAAPRPLDLDVGAPSAIETGLELRRAAPTGTRGRRRRPAFSIRTDISLRSRLVLGVAGVALVFAAWAIAAVRVDDRALLPTPAATFDALQTMWSSGVFMDDLQASLTRVGIGYAISVALGIVIGVAIGSFASAEAFFEPQLGFLRYIPASALTPLFMLWLGIGESPKIWLIVLGTVFFNILMIADVARGVPRELLHASYTLGAGRRTVLRRVILPFSWPGIIDVARVNLAAAWLMLVVSELLAAQDGLAYRIIRAQRFRAVDTMFALLIVFGIIGLVSDVALRAIRNWVAPWARG